LFGKVSGARFLGLTFAWSTMMVQTLCGVLSGMGRFLVLNGWPAKSQVATIAGIKLGWCSVLVCCAPCTCLLTNTVASLQFGSEGFSSLLLLIAGETGNPEVTDAAFQITFWLLLGPVFYPVLMKAYDGVFVQIVNNCCRKKFNAQAAATAGCILLLTIPAFLGRAFGVKVGGGGTKQMAASGGSCKGLVNDLFRAKNARKAGKKRVSVGSMRQLPPSEMELAAAQAAGQTPSADVTSTSVADGAAADATLRVASPPTQRDGALSHLETNLAMWRVVAATERGRGRGLSAERAVQQLEQLRLDKDNEEREFREHEDRKRRDREERERNQERERKEREKKKKEEEDEEEVDFDCDAGGD